MAWVAGADVTVGDLITAAQWNNYLGAGGDIDLVKRRELVVPCSRAITGGVSSPITGWGDMPAGVLTALNDYAIIFFRCPSDFTAITTASIIMLPSANQAAANWDITSDYGAAGEAYTTHSESDAATTYNVTLWQLFEVDVSGILTGMLADDYVGIKLVMATAGHTAGIVGFYMKYT